MKRFKVKNYKGCLLESIKKFSEKFPRYRIVEVKETEDGLALKADKVVSEAYRSPTIIGKDQNLASYLPDGFPLGRHEEIWLWEIDPKDPELEEVRVFVGHNVDVVQNYFETECDPESYLYFIELPSRKAEYEKDGWTPDKNDKVEIRGHLPKEKQKTIINAIENKFGVTLDEKKYMASKGKVLAFIRVQDKNKENPPEVYRFKDWEAVSDLAYFK